MKLAWASKMASRLENVRARNSVERRGTRRETLTDYLKEGERAWLRDGERANRKGIGLDAKLARAKESVLACWMVQRLVHAWDLSKETQRDEKMGWWDLMWEQCTGWKTPNK